MKSGGPASVFLAFRDLRRAALGPNLVHPLGSLVMVLSLLHRSLAFSRGGSESLPVLGRSPRVV